MDIVSFILDSELGGTSFNVERINYNRSREGTASCSEMARVVGCIHPGKTEMIQLFPTEEKSETFITVYTDYPLSTGTPDDAGASFVAPDRIHWNGKTWRVVKVRDWLVFGYVQAYAVLMHEETV